MLRSKLVPNELSEWPSVSEALLDVNEERIQHLKLDGGWIVTGEKLLATNNPYVLQKNTIGPALRPDLPEVRQHLEQAAARIAGQYKGELNSLDHLFPPKGRKGEWNTKQRLYRCRYNDPVLRGKPIGNAELFKKYDIQDMPAYWHAVRSGTIIPCINELLDTESIRKNEMNTMPVGLVYRGCSQPYDYPFQHGIGRRKWETSVSASTQSRPLSSTAK